jgi:hypothetical protein
MSRDSVEAQQLLDNRLFNASFNDLRDNLIMRIEDNDLKDDVMRDKVMLSLQLLKAIKGYFEQRVQEGALDNTNNIDIL